MNIQDIHLIYDYNYWARDRILRAAERVTEEQYIMPATFPFGGLRGTLVHILDAEISWRTFFERSEWMAELGEADFPTLARLRTAWDVEEASMRAFLARLTDADLENILAYTTDEGDRRRILWHCLLHVVNHGTQHRAEAAALLTTYGASPGEVDFTQFLNAVGKA